MAADPSLHNAENNAQIPPPEERYKANLEGIIEVTADISKLLTKYNIKFDSGISDIGLELAREVIANSNSLDLIKNFISKSAAYWELIRHRDPSFFNDHMAIVFGFEDYKQVIASVCKVQELKDQAVFVDNNDQPIDPSLVAQFKSELVQISDELWVILTACVKIAVAYVDAGREPVYVNVKDPNTDAVIRKRRYTKKFYLDLNIGELVKLWDVKLKL